LDSISKRQGKLAEIRKLLIQDFKKHFNKNFRMESPFIGKRADSYNKKALVAYFNGKDEVAEELWNKAINTSNSHFYSCFNLGMKQFHGGEVSAGRLRADFSDDVFEHRMKGSLLKATMLVSTGHRHEGEAILDEYIAEVEAAKKKTRRGINYKQKTLLERAN